MFQPQQGPPSGETTHFYIVGGREIKLHYFMHWYL